MSKRITFSADEELLRKAREKAKRENTTLNVEFRKWLNLYVATDRRQIDFKALMESLAYANSGRSFNRDEMKER
jgi:predicted transcriptional regulator